MMQNIKKYFWTGIATVFPVFITLYIIVFLIQLTESFIGKYINNYLGANYGFKIPGIGLLLLIIFILVAGVLSRLFIGRWFSAKIDHLFKKIPLIANIYPSAKELSDFLFTEESKEKFQKAVLVEFPTPGSWSLGFITNDEKSDLNEGLNDNYVCVFVPLAPAPFSGFVYWAEKEKIKELNISIERAIKFIVSGGVISK